MSELSRLVDSTNLDYTGPIEVDAANSVAYIVSYSNGKLSSIDISNPSSMSISDTISLMNGYDARNIKLDTSSNVLYSVGSSTDGIKSVDVSNPASLSVLDTLTNGTNMNGAYGIALNLAGPASTRAY